MASGSNEKPTCPVCHQADQVKTTEAAYNSGIAACAPPDMPTRQVSMFKYICSCMILIGICVFCIIVFIGGGASWPFVGQSVLLGITIVSILSTLGVSYYAFQQVVHGDNEASALFPAWDTAMAAWKNLYYCSRDGVVFDAKTNGVVSNEQLANLRDFKGQSGEIHPAALVSH
jgi:hypothetical protein